jgi:hypothetical protein
MYKVEEREETRELMGGGGAPDSFYFFYIVSRDNQFVGLNWLGNHDLDLPSD